MKTIGDAVMASFVDPLDGLRAALDMQARIARLNARRRRRAVGLKVGLHAGACLAVTLNDRLDYFGQTVNSPPESKRSPEPTRSSSPTMSSHCREQRSSSRAYRSTGAQWS